MSRPLTQGDKVAAFEVATSGLRRRYAPDPIPPMDDTALEAALREELGIAAGRCGPGEMHISWQGAGLKIWASWHIHNMVQERPVFEGKSTILMAREIYAIANPADRQLALF